MAHGRNDPRAYGGKILAHGPGHQQHLNPKGAVADIPHQAETRPLIKGDAPEPRLAPGFILGKIRMFHLQNQTGRVLEALREQVQQRASAARAPHFGLDGQKGDQDIRALADIVQAILDGGNVCALGGEGKIGAEQELFKATPRLS